jgi:DNA-binding cell septation regulator SpoVG
VNIEVNKIVLVPEAFHGAPYQILAFVEIVLADVIVVKDVTLMERRLDGAMILQFPSKRRVAHCPQCRKRGDVADNWCRWCGLKFEGADRPTLLTDKRPHRDVCHPIDRPTRDRITWAVIDAVAAARANRNIPLSIVA